MKIEIEISDKADAYGLRGDPGRVVVLSTTRRGSQPPRPNADVRS